MLFYLFWQHQWRDSRPAPAPRQPRPARNQFHSQKVWPAPGRLSIVVDEQWVGFRGGEGYRDVVGVGVKGREGRVGQFVEAEGGELAVVPVVVVVTSGKKFYLLTQI